MIIIIYNNIIITSAKESAHLSNTPSMYSLESEQYTSVAYLAILSPTRPIPAYNSAMIA